VNCAVQILWQWRERLGWQRNVFLLQQAEQVVLGSRFGNESLEEETNNPNGRRMELMTDMLSLRSPG
jgi:hypothetical protein